MVNVRQENILEKSDSFVQALLFEAINKDEVEWLINHGVDVNHRDMLGITALWDSGSLSLDYSHREAEKQRSREAEKQRSREAEKQRSRDHSQFILIRGQC